jgi:hypothetical protein
MRCLSALNDRKNSISNEKFFKALRIFVHSEHNILKCNTGLIGGEAINIPNIKQFYIRFSNPSF